MQRTQVFDNSTNNHDGETSFAEAYKSQILNPSDEEEERSSLPKIIGIVILVALISGLSIYGYQYINKNKKTEEHSSPEEVTLPQSSIMIDNIEDLEEDTPKEKASQLPTSNKSDNAKKSGNESVTDIADKVKIELSKELDKETSVKKEEKKSEIKLSSPKQKGEDTYLEQLAELSKEIDGEEK